MQTAQEFKGKYHQVKGRIKERFGALSDDDLDRASGSMEQLVGKIQEKTGEARRTVENFVNDLFEGASSTASRVASQVQDYASQAGSALREGYDYAASSAREGYDQARATVQHYPVQSMAVVLGAGILIGAALGMILSRARW